MKILYFSTAATQTGLREETWPLAEPVTLAACWEGLLARHPGLAALRNCCLVARNQEFVRDEETLLQPGDEIALLPPFSGG